MPCSHFTESDAAAAVHRRLAALAVIAISLFAAGCASTDPADYDTADEYDAAAIAASDPAVRERYESALALQESGDLAGAEARLLDFVSVYQFFPGAYTNLAIIYRRSQRPDEAQQALVRALEIEPTFVPALNELGVLHREAGRFPEAESAYLKAITADPGYALAHYNLGVLRELYMGQPEAALAHYERYQALTSGKDEMVAMWIVDIRRRLGIETQSARAD